MTPKLLPPKIGPAGPILAEKLAKTGPPDHFCCQIGPEGTILSTETGSPWQFWSHCEMHVCNNVAIAN